MLIRVPLSWLREYVDGTVSADDVAHRLHMAGTESKGIERKAWDKIWVGRIAELAKHPDADKLQLATVEYGEGRRKTVVTGATNLRPGSIVAYGEVGAEYLEGHTGERTIMKPKDMRGIKSEGMVLSEKELGIGEDHDGILLLDPTLPVGAPLSEAQRKALGLGSRRPFYTVDLPYLWGRLLESNGAIFGAGLVPPYVGTPSRFPVGDGSMKNATRDLRSYDVRRGQSADRLRWLENRVRNLHPALESVRITHRWGGPILLTEKMLPIFRRHPCSKQVLILAGYNGHGVALSVYLGKWAAEALLARRALPSWE